MHPLSLVYKGINRLGRVDITRVLKLDTRKMKAVDICSEARCHWVDEAELTALLEDSEFKITRQFVEDFRTLGFRGVAASIDGKLVGLLFLMSGSISGRHNSGGTHFNGIGLNLPEAVEYLFKVIVKPDFRGQRVNGSMLMFAVQQLHEKGVDAIVTTTDWTNIPFLSSVERLGFKRCGYASEFVFFGQHFYQLPMRLSVTTKTSDERAVQFVRESSTPSVA